MESWVVGFDGDTDVERHSGAVEAATEEDLTPGAGQAPPLRVRLISDYICPWCYIGLARLEQLMDEFAIEFDVSAYELRPGLPPEGLLREKLQANRVYPPGYLDNMRQTAREAAIEMKRPPLVPNTRRAHEATEFAKEAGRLLPFHRAVFRAYWEANGLLDFWRNPKAFYDLFSTVNAPDVIIAHTDRYAYWDDEVVKVALHGSHFSGEEWSGAGRGADRVEPRRRHHRRPNVYL